MRIMALYRLVILKQRFPASSRKTIVRSTIKCSVLTIIDSHASTINPKTVYFVEESSSMAELLSSSF